MEPLAVELLAGSPQFTVSPNKVLAIITPHQLRLPPPGHEALQAVDEGTGGQGAGDHNVDGLGDETSE